MTLSPEDHPEAMPPRPPVAGQGQVAPASDADLLPPPAGPATTLPPPAGPATTLPPPGGPATTLPPPPSRPTVTGKRHPYTRIRAAWVGVWAGIVAIILLIIFVGQNTAAIDIHFLWMDGNIPAALALLIAGVGGAIIALAVSAARMIQMRRHMRG